MRRGRRILMPKRSVVSARHLRVTFVNISSALPANKHYIAVLTAKSTTGKRNIRSNARNCKRKSRNDREREKRMYAIELKRRKEGNVN
jgi:hypothetical protein